LHPPCRDLRKSVSNKAKIVIYFTGISQGALSYMLSYLSDPNKSKYVNELKFILSGLQEQLATAITNNSTTLANMIIDAEQQLREDLLDSIKD